jgi:hypothetical protein
MRDAVSVAAILAERLAVIPIARQKHGLRAAASNNGGNWESTYAIAAACDATLSSVAPGR